MTLINKTSMALKAAWSYCRRCLAVMLCCVLVFGLTCRTAPRAEAVDAAAITTVGTWAADAIASTVGFESLVGSAGLVLTLGADMGDRLEHMSRGYDLGYALDNAIRAGELSDATLTWWTETVDSFKAKNGIASGDSFTIPAAVAEEIRSWMLANFQFSDGVLNYTDRVITVDGQRIILTEKPSSIKIDRWYKNASVHYGSRFNATDRFSFSFPQSSGAVATYTLSADRPGSEGQPYFHMDVDGVTKWYILMDEDCYAFFWLYENYSKVYLAPGVYAPNLGVIFETGHYDFYPLVSEADISDVTTTIKETPATSTPVTKDLTVTVPADLPVTKVGDYTVPVIGDLAAEDVLKTPGAEIEDNPAVSSGLTAKDITAAITDALPITGSVAGDQVMEEINRDPDSLGAVFITKFPFSIPWDIVEAIKLLAAPPVTPRWEVDFMQPIAHRVGGFQGSTKLVLDFSEYEIIGQVTRWTSTLMFVYSLAMGTKKLMWTA